MPVAADAIVAGSYQATWNALGIGQVGIGGYRHRWSYSKKDVFFDAVGNVPVDQLFTGISMYVDFILMQVAAPAVPTLTWPWTIIRGVTNSAGDRIWDLAKPLILTACDQVNTTPKDITFMKTIIAPDYEVLRNFSGTEEQMIPVRLIVLPVKYDSGGYASPVRPVACTDVAYYTETYPA